jgi:hypothetical protein
MRIASEKTDDTVLCVHGNAVAIPVLPGRGDSRPNGNILQFAYSLERIAHLSPFHRNLGFVIDMLIRAAAASTEIWASWNNPMRGTLLNLDQVCFGKPRFFPDDFRRNKFALNRVRNKDHFPLFPRNTFSAESDVFDSQINKAHFINTPL